MQFTYTAKIHDFSCYSVLDLMAFEQSRIKRSLFKRKATSSDLTKDIKREYLKKYEITARQFNALNFEVDGLLSSHKELKKNLIKKVNLKKKNYEKQLSRCKSAFKIHQFKRKIQILNQKLDRYTEHLKHPNVCFGSKALFQKQFHLNQNGYTSHEEWKKDWDFSRNSSFFLVGSKGEKLGNQSCQLLPGKIKLRLTSKIAEARGNKYLFIPIEFTYSQEKLEFALASQQAMNYRFVKKENGFWYIHLTFHIEQTEILTHSRYGVLGIDLNPACIAACHVDAYGNLIKAWQVSLNLAGKRSDQREALLSEEVKKLVAYAVEHQTPISIEKLDFEKKKQELRSRKMNRMLSEFSYSLFDRLITTRCYRLGVEIKKFNPAYTSIIGDVKFSHGYGLSTHMAAAMAIARRFQGFGERIRMKTQVHFLLPVIRRNRKKHVWSDWARLNQMAKRRRGEKLSTFLLRRQRLDRTQSEQSSSETLLYCSSPRTLTDFENKAIFH